MRRVLMISTVLLLFSGPGRTQLPPLVAGERCPGPRDGLSGPTRPGEQSAMNPAKPGPRAGAPVPPLFNPGLVRSDTVKYVQRVSVSGREITVSITRSIRKVRLGATSAWQVVDLVASPMGQGSDTLEIDAGSLMPIRRSGRQGPQTLRLDFSPRAIRGTMSSGAMSVPVNVKTSGLALPDGAGLEVPLTTLPLHDGYTTSLGLFDLMSMKVQPVTLTVAGTEKITIASGALEAWKVEMMPRDDPAGAQTFWIARESRRILRSEARLPAAMGGGIAVSEMVGP
jgi:hypothetical protein